MVAGRVLEVTNRLVERARVRAVLVTDDKSGARAISAAIESELDHELVLKQAAELDKRVARHSTLEDVRHALDV